jgi:hypothetical protein
MSEYLKELERLLEAEENVGSDGTPIKMEKDRNENRIKIYIDPSFQDKNSNWVAAELFGPITFKLQLWFTYNFWLGCKNSKTGGLVIFEKYANHLSKLGISPTYTYFGK